MMEQYSAFRVISVLPPSFCAIVMFLRNIFNPPPCCLHALHSNNLKFSNVHSLCHIENADLRKATTTDWRTRVPTSLKPIGV